jgi:hypothetical protein
MRSTRLRPALAAAATLLVLGPMAAPAVAAHPRLNARKQAGPNGCQISIFAEPRVVTTGEQVQVFGQVACPGGANAAGQMVTIFEHSAGTPGFKSLGPVSAGPGGFYTLIAPPVTTDATFYARASGARSANKHVKVAPQITLVPPPNAPDGAQLHTGQRNRVTFTGAVTPADLGATVVLQRESAAVSEDWIPIQFGTVGPGSTYSLTHRFAVPGDANLRVVVRPHGRFTVRGVSNALSYQISQAENPRLLINSSADPISYGQTVNISGVLAAGANQKVTLLTHTHGQGLTFTKVDEQTTGSGGTYSFTAKPLVNTTYRVKGAGVTSASLFEGVKYVLTAASSATSVQAGHAVTFSGTVTPAHAGHIVWLERENAFGGGFHVVDEGTVNSSGTYTITHFMFGAGKAGFRVKASGDPENQAAASSLFSIEITPAPPGSLRPVPAGKLPDEGHV